MSRQSKNARNLARAKQITQMHLNGEKGPARTMPSHGKKWGYRDNPEVQKRIAEMLKSSSVIAEKTSGARILRSAGGASKE